MAEAVIKDPKRLNENDASELAQRIAHQALDNYVKGGVLVNDEVSPYKDDYAKLKHKVLETYNREKLLIKKAKTLNNDLLSEKIILEKHTIQQSEELSLSNCLEKEKEKSLKDSRESSERDTILAYELAELERERRELVQQRDKKLQEMTEKAEPEIRKITAETATLSGELSKTKDSLITHQDHKSEYAKRLNALDTQYSVFKDEVTLLRRDFAKLKADPGRIKKQADVIEKAVGNMESEVLSFTQKVASQSEILQDQGMRHKEAEEVQQEIDQKLGIHRESIERNQREVDHEGANLDEEKNAYHALLDRRVQLDIELKAAGDNARRSNDRLNSATKEFDRLKKLLKKKQMLSDSAKSIIPNLKAQVSDTKHQIKLFKSDNKELLNRQYEMKQEVDVFIAKYLRQEGVEKGKKSDLVQLIGEVKTLESDLSDWVSEESKQNRVIAMLTSQREIKAREASNASQNERNTVQELKIKELVLFDFAKKCTETNNRLKEFSALYDVVKNERNKYVNLIQQSSQALAEMKERIKILQNEVGVLRNESLAKDKALSRERMAHQAAQCNRDGLRLDTNKCHVVYRKKQEQVEQQIVEIDKLNSIINTMEKDMLRLKKKYEIAVDARNFTGVQLIDQNDELCILYEKSNIQEGTLKNGELHTREKAQEIRMLAIQINEQKRRIAVTRKHMPVLPQLAKQILDLQQELSLECQMVDMLCRDLEAPNNCDRWRELEGEDPEEDQLVSKIEFLEERLSSKKEQLLEKELVLEEVSSLAIKLRNQASEGREGTLRMSKQVNDFQSLIKDMTRKMMTTVSELSMFQATAIKLNQERKELKACFEEAEWNYKEGRCPNENAEVEWHRAEREKLRRAESGFQSDLPHTNTPLDVLKTTAEPRPNAYVPENMGVPKPYGGQAPFKPSYTGTTMRHTRKPHVKDIEI